MSSKDKDKKIKCKYYGSVTAPEVKQESVQNAVSLAFQNAKLQKGLPHKVLLSLTEDMQVQLVEPKLKSVLSCTAIQDVICCGTCKLDNKSPKKPDDILAFMVRSGDERVSVLQCHVIQGGAKEILSAYQKIDEAILLLSEVHVIPPTPTPSVMISSPQLNCVRVLYRQAGSTGSRV